MRSVKRLWPTRAIGVAFIVAVLLAGPGCGSQRGGTGHLDLSPAVPGTGIPAQPASPVDDSSDSPLPGVFALDGIFGGGKSARNGTQIVSLGADVADAEGNFDTSGTRLNLRAIEPGAYSYGIYGQDVGEEMKPISTLIDTEPTNSHGGRDDEIPLSYLIGVADYSVGSWRWFGPFGDVDVIVQVNTETLKSRFKSPSDRFYLVMLAVNGSKAVSALPAEGLVADWPLGDGWRTASAEDDDPGGVRVEQVVTDTAPGDEVPTEPAVVTGLSASADESGVTLTWDTNLDPDVDIYQVGREDPDVADSFELLTGVFAPIVTYKDVTGAPAHEYRYMVRAHNPVGYGGWTVVMAVRSGEPSAPTVLSVWPTSGYSDAAATFTASVSGSPPLTYSWDFAGGAIPGTSADESPTVTLGDEGDYECSLTVSNALGDDTYYFTLSVTWMGHQPPVISSVSPTSGITGAEVQFSASVAGTSPLSYSWDFGGGATPNSSSEATPTVTLSATGEYWASLTVTNDYGEDYFDFTLTVGEPPTISSVSPTAVLSGWGVQFMAELSGSEPLAYGWDFGGGATPNTSTSESPTVIPGSRGEYEASVTISNDYGEDTFDFIFVVYEPGRGDWWMFGREPTHNHRSPYVGAQTDNLKWRYEIWGMVAGASPAIGVDGTIYVGDYGYLYAINREGTLRWQNGVQPSSSPAIGADGTVYVGGAAWDGGYHNYLYAIYPDGTSKWRYQTDGSVNSSPAIGADGTVYVGSWDNYLYAISPDGSLKWRYETWGMVETSPAIGADGTIYVVGGSYLCAITDDGTEGTLKWKYETWGGSSSPAIGADGTVYVGGGNYLYAITDDETEGTLKWQWRYTGDMSVNSGPAIGADGTIYIGSGDYHVYAITDNDTEGMLKWRYQTGGYVNSSPAIGADGTVYVGSGDGYVYAISPADATLKWSYDTRGCVDSSPAIGADGTVYVGGHSDYPEPTDYLYAFGD